MKLLSFLLALLASTCTAGSKLDSPAEKPPLRSGDYTFTHKFAEHPDMVSIQLYARVRGRHISLINRSDEVSPFPKGLVASGTLMWHARSGQWIIGTSPTDREAAEVGGCSDGPSVVDLQTRIYWTC